MAKRKQYSSSFKARVALAAIRGKGSASRVADGMSVAWVANLTAQQFPLHAIELSNQVGAVRR